MKSDTIDRRQVYQPNPRPEWVARINAEGHVLGDGLVALDEESLMAEASRSTGLSDFGDGDWRRHFRVLLRAIEEEGQLNLLGRLLTRADFLMYLRARLQIVDWYRRHPEIEGEQITEPVFIVGLPRSGTTILHETLAEDSQFRVVKKWEALFPCPPPTEATYLTDERIRRAHDFITIQDRIAPEWRSMHAVGGELPVECIEFTTASFLSEMFTASFNVPSYQKHLYSEDIAEMYRWHRKVLKLLQWRFKRPHWLMKGCNHEPYIPQLLAEYPDARIIFTHRDPIKSVSSVVSVQGTIFRFRTDSTFSDSYEQWLRLDLVAAMLEKRIGWIEDGTLPAGQIANLLFSEFSDRPVEALRKLYHELRLTWTDATQSKIAEYLAKKPKDVFGAHRYVTGDEHAVRAERALFKRYQDYFGVRNEV